MSIVGQAQAQLKSKEVTLKDTRVLGGIDASGWGEEWLWVTQKGKKSWRMKIIFSTDPEGGTLWFIKDL